MKFFFGEPSRREIFVNTNFIINTGSLKEREIKTTRINMWFQKIYFYPNIADPLKYYKNMT